MVGVVAHERDELDVLRLGHKASRASQVEGTHSHERQRGDGNDQAGAPAVREHMGAAAHDHLGDEDSQGPAEGHEQRHGERLAAQQRQAGEGIGNVCETIDRAKEQGRGHASQVPEHGAERAKRHAAPRSLEVAAAKQPACQRQRRECRHDGTDDALRRGNLF